MDAASNAPETLLIIGHSTCMMEAVTCWQNDAAACLVTGSGYLRAFLSDPYNNISQPYEPQSPERWSGFISQMCSWTSGMQSAQVKRNSCKTTEPEEMCTIPQTHPQTINMQDQARRPEPHLLSLSNSSLLWPLITFYFSALMLSSTIRFNHSSLQSCCRSTRFGSPQIQVRVLAESLQHLFPSGSAILVGFLFVHSFTIPSSWGKPAEASCFHRHAPMCLWNFFYNQQFFFSSPEPGHVMTNGGCCSL